MPPPLSKFAQSAGGSVVVGMRRLADAVEARGVSVIDFGIGEPDFDAPEPVKGAAIRAIQDGNGTYVDPRGLRELREEISAFEGSRHGLEINAEQIVVTPGSYGALSAVTRALLDPDADAVIVEPGWGPYKAITSLTGATPIGAPMPVVDGRFILDAASLEAAVTTRTRAIMINTPWNPTGRVLTRAELENVAMVAERHDLWIIADEVYSELVYGEARHLSVAALGPEIAARTVIVTSLSKSFAMTGWRLGYCIAPPDLAPLLARINQYTSRCATSFVQHAAVAALQDSISFVDDMRAQYAARRDAVARGLNAIDGISCPSPEGTFYAFASFDETWGDSRNLASYLLEHAGVLLTPGSAYGPASSHHIRLSFATDLAMIEEGIARMKDALPPPEKLTSSD